MYIQEDDNERPFVSRVISRLANYDGGVLPSVEQDPADELDIADETGDGKGSKKKKKKKPGANTVKTLSGTCRLLIADRFPKIHFNAPFKLRSLFCIEVKIGMFIHNGIHPVIQAN